MGVFLYPPITLYKGATSTVEFDFSEFDFWGGEVRLTIKDKAGNTIFEESFSETKKYTYVFSEKITADFEVSTEKYKYDLMHHIGSERYPLCSPSDVIVKETVGGYESEW